MKLLRGWFTRHPTKHPPTHDDVLGTVSWSVEAEAWVAAVPTPGVELHLAGETAPHPALVTHARELVANISALHKAFEALLAREVSSFPPSYTSEILALEIETIDFPWPERPTSAMIWLRGGDDYRMWRCDYDAGSLRNLGFDD